MCCRAASLARWSILDACVRLLPGVMGAASSGEEESFEDGASRISALYPTCRMGRAHDPRSAAIGGSCEDRRVATRTRGRRYTAKAAGPDRAPRGRIAGTALWRAATRYEGEDEMNLIQTLEREAIDALTKPTSPFPNSAPATRCASASRSSKASAPASRSSKASASPAPTRASAPASPSARSASARASSASSRSIRRTSTRSRSCAAATSAAPSSIICAAAPASRPASPSAATVRKDVAGGKLANRPAKRRQGLAFRARFQS